MHFICSRIFAVSFNFFECKKYIESHMQHKVLSAITSFMGSLGNCNNLFSVFNCYVFYITTGSCSKLCFDYNKNCQFSFKCR